MKSSLMITGISSFVGHHLADWFADSYDVVGIHSKPLIAYQGIAQKRLARLGDRIRFCELDLTDEESGRNRFEELQCDFVIHHAGYTKNYRNWNYDLTAAMEVNLKPLLWMVSVLKKNRCQGLIVTGSSSEYSNSNDFHDEADRCEPTSLYGLSKLSETQLACLLTRKQDLETRIARVFNPFGVLDDPKKLVPYVISSLRDGNPVELSAPDHIRNYYGVEFLCMAYEALLLDLREKRGSEIVNICPRQGYSNREVALTLADLMGTDPELLSFNPTPSAGQPTRCIGRWQKLFRLIDENIHFDLKTSLRRMVEDERSV